MKKLSVSVALAVLVSLLVLGGSTAFARGPKDDCVTIQDGTIFAVDGALIVPGYDKFGYNYQAHMFNGLYGNYSRPELPLIEDDTWLQMKWNDAWLSNKDCDHNGLLDRHYGFDDYRGSGAWLTNHQWGTYEGEDGKPCKWTYFVKIVAAPSDADAVGGVWYTADGVEIGPAIWGAFAIIQEVSNDKCAGEHGLLYKSPVAPGFGVYKPKPDTAFKPLPFSIQPTSWGQIKRLFK